MDVKKDFAIEYTILCAFLQSYKEKLMLSRKLHDILDGEIITLEHLKKVKEGYTDQFSLDYQILEKGMEAIGF